MSLWLNIILLMYCIVTLVRAIVHEPTRQKLGGYIVFVVLVTVITLINIGANLYGK